jgi:hypothetical protein
MGYWWQCAGGLPAGPFFVCKAGQARQANEAASALQHRVQLLPDLLEGHAMTDRYDEMAERLWNELDVLPMGASLVLIAQAIRAAAEEARAEEREKHVRYCERMCSHIERETCGLLLSEAEREQARAEEREACADIAENIGRGWDPYEIDTTEPECVGDNIADAIRARGGNQCE